MPQTLQRPRASSISSPHAERIERLREQMERHRLDCYLVFDRREQYWLTGFTGEDGAGLVTRKHVVLLTDGRFQETAAKEAPFARAVVRKQRGPEATVRELRRVKANRVGFDPDHLTVRAYAELKKAAEGVRLVSTSRLIGALRQRKDEIEIGLMRQAIGVAEQAFRQMQSWIEPGMREREVAARLVYEMQQLGASGAAFAPIVAVGPNGSLPHYAPGDRRVTPHEGVLVDWGACVEWYNSDLTRMIWMGTIPPEISEAYQVVKDAHQKAIEAVRPGVQASAVDRAARNHIQEAGYGKNFTHSVGHGLGLQVHEAPGLRRQSAERLEPGMVITIEPGIYLPGVGGIRIEDDVLVTPTGAEVLSTLPR